MGSAFKGSVIQYDPSMLSASKMVEDWNELLTKDKNSVYFLKKRRLLPTIKFKGFYFWNGSLWDRLDKYIPNVSAVEVSAGAEEAIRRFSPKNIQDMIMDNENWSDYVLNSEFVEEISADGYRLFKYNREGVMLYRKVELDPYEDTIYSNSNLSSELVRR